MRDDVFIEGALAMDGPVILFIVFGQWIFLASLFRDYGIGMEFLQSLISGIHYGSGFWMQMQL